MNHQDWDRASDPEVRKIITKRAKQIAYEFDHVIEAADLEQEAVILISTKPEYLTTDLSFISKQLHFDLIDLCKTPARRRAKNIPLITEQDDARELVTEYVPLSPTAGGYTREMVELLLPAIWDESYCYGLPARENAPDPDMPRGSTNVAHGNNLPAYIADVKSGWAKTPLSIRERRAVLLKHGVCLMDREIAEFEGCSRSTITHRLEAAVTKITNYLNGADEATE